jgi:hypothetical protein
MRLDWTPEPELDDIYAWHLLINDEPVFYEMATGISEATGKLIWEATKNETVIALGSDARTIAEAKWQAWKAVRRQMVYDFLWYSQEEEMWMQEELEQR